MMNNGSPRKRPRLGDGAALGDIDSSSFFIPCPAWQGAKDGYFFGTGDRGTGYYRDVNKETNRPATVNELPKSGAGVASAETNEGVSKARRKVMIAEDRNKTHTIMPRNKERSAAVATKDEQQQQQQQQQALLLAQAEAAAEGTKLVELSVKGIQQAGVALTKAINKNQMQRVKYPNEPEQYMDSEVTLYEHVAALQAIAAAPDTLYEAMMQAEIPSMLLQLAAQHENTDVLTAVWAVWAEWLDSSSLMPKQDAEHNELLVVRPVVNLANQFLQDGIEILMESLGRLEAGKGNEEKDSDSDDDDVGQGIAHILNVIENLLEMDNMLPLIRGGDSEEEITLNQGKCSVTQQLCHPKFGLLGWLLQQADLGDQETTTKPWRDRSLEILALLAPREELYQLFPDWTRLASYHSAWGAKGKSDSKTLDGIEILLQGVAKFRKQQPTTESELDALENSCIILDAALTYSVSNVQAFVDAQGMELVFRCLKERVHAGGIALKWLHFAGSEPVHQQACLHMVAQASGLKFLLPLWMDRNLPKPALLDATSKKEAKRRKKEWSNNLEQTTIRILYALTKHLPDEDPHDCQSRFIAKFADDTTKCHRLVELLIAYDQKARMAEYQFYRSDVEETLPNEEAVQLAALEAKLAGGGDVFHRLGAMAAFLCVQSKVCHESILARLRQQQSGMSLVSMAVQEFISVLGESDQKHKLESYLEKL